MKANHLTVSLLLHAGAIAAAVSLISAAKPLPDAPPRVERVTVLAPLAKRTRPRLVRARSSKPSVPVLPVPAPAPQPPVRGGRRFNPPAPAGAGDAAGTNAESMIAIPDVAIVQSQSPLSNQSVAVALPPPQLKIGVIGNVQAGAIAGFVSSSTPARILGSFGDARVVHQEIRPAPSITKGDQPQSFPVEIFSKPHPIYTEEARKLRIQGQVLLEVTFRAAGDVQILRTVRGLGHGLDEAAEDAARQIRFRPARRGELAVDATAIVHISFELAY